MTLSEYDYTIEHIPSSPNQISDSLSRLYQRVNALSQFVFKISDDDIFGAQKENKDMDMILLLVNLGH